MDIRHHGIDRKHHGWSRFTIAQIQMHYDTGIAHLHQGTGWIIQQSSPVGLCATGLTLTAQICGVLCYRPGVLWHKWVASYGIGLWPLQHFTTQYCHPVPQEVHPEQDESWHEFKCTLAQAHGTLWHRCIDMPQYVTMAHYGEGMARFSIAQDTPQHGSAVYLSSGPQGAPVLPG